MVISEDTAGSLIMAVNGIRTIFSEEDEERFLAVLIERAGGLQNLWSESACGFTRVEQPSEWICSECRWPVSICADNPCKAVAQGGDVCAGIGDSIECDAHNPCCRHARRNPRSPTEPPQPGPATVTPPTRGGGSQTGASGRPEGCCGGVAGAVD